jgi:hypothetical protein
VVCLLYSSREIALGCISKACRAHGWPLGLSSVSGKYFVPQISQERLAGADHLLCLLCWCLECKMYGPGVSCGFSLLDSMGHCRICTGTPADASAA